MAEGLSFPALSLGSPWGSLERFISSATADDSSSNGVSRSGNGSGGGQNTLLDSLDLEGLGISLDRLVPPGGFELDPNGTYRFSRFAASSSIDIAFSQSTLAVNDGEEGTSLFASVTDISISISVSAEFEQALIETGRSRNTQELPDDFRAASQAAVDRFVARNIRASLQFDLNFSQTSLSFNSLGEGLEDLQSVGGDETLAGFLTLIESFFGDDERFEDFVKSLEKFLADFGQGAGSESVPVEAPEAVPGGGSSSDAVYESRSLSVSVDLSFESTEISVSQGEGQAKDPIVLDLDGDGIELTSAREGVDFDLDADGVAERTATAAGGDGLLALDRNGNGVIDDGRELFGDQNGAANGFEELARFDSNSDGVIDTRDAVYDQLRVFVDRNLDGRSQQGELISLLDAGIASIHLDARNVKEAAAGGNTIAQRSFFTRTDGSRGQAVDALLNRLV